MFTRSFVLVAVATSVLASSAAASQETARDRARGPYKIGFERMRAEAWDEAVAAFREAIDIDQSFELAHYMLGRAYMAQKQFLTAVGAFAKARSLYLADAGRQFSSAQDAQRYRRDRLMEIDLLLGDLRRMPQTRQVQDQIRQLEDYRRLVQQGESRGNNFVLDTGVPAYVSLSLGSAYFRSGNLAEAERYYREAIDADPKSGEAHNNLAVVYMETGRYADAERSVKAAEKTGFRVPPALKAEIAKRKRGT
jgi:Tfp pilus assembly protein PilF